MIHHSLRLLSEYLHSFDVTGAIWDAFGHAKSMDLRTTWSDEVDQWYFHLHLTKSAMGITLSCIPGGLTLTVGQS